MISSVLTFNLNGSREEYRDLSFNEIWGMMLSKQIYDLKDDLPVQQKQSDFTFQIILDCKFGLSVTNK